MAVLSWLVFAFLAFLQVVAGSPRFGRDGDEEAHQRESRQAKGDKYLIGVGKADITGPVVEVNFAGYADTAQVGTGLRQRIYSRAFIVGEVGNPKNRFVYLVIDTQSGDTAINNGILEGVAALGSAYSVYGRANIAVTGTHSHSGPGGWFNYLLPQITSLGFDKQSYQAIVDGAVLSIKRAHESLQEGYLSLGTTRITGANINRSLYSYLANPASERAQYADDVDKDLTLLRFQRASDLKHIGVLTWFPTHGTSMLGNNTHVSGDNKGFAAIHLEQTAASLPTVATPFVAGFSQSNVGDTTPNVLGAYCDDGSGLPCAFATSTCADGKSQSCHGRGPFFAVPDLGVTSCQHIGRLQSRAALSLLPSSSLTPITNPTVRAFHTYLAMPYHAFPLPNGTTVQTCPAALGHSFAAGTSDWPGAFDFTQGDSGAPNNPLWSVVGGLLRTPSAQQKACQGAKPILLDVGEMDAPYAWSPNTVDIQAFRVGQLLIIVSPAETTTMAGRRWRNAVASAAKSTLDLDPDSDLQVVLGGPANVYSHYATTPEEYDVQRYEGASTLYGKWTLDAYIHATVSRLSYLRSNATGSSPDDTAPSPPDNRRNSLYLGTGVVVDGVPLGQSFGQCTAQPAAQYARGAVISATFNGANPRNNLRLEGTFAAVEKQGSDGKTWNRVRSDEDWDLVYTWTRTNWLLGWSSVTLKWETGTGDGRAVEPGVYRFRYFGDSKPLVGSVRAFEGVSGEFRLV